MIPAIILESLQTNHPACNLYYTIPFSTFSGEQTRDDLPYNTDSSRTEQNILRIAEIWQIIEATTPQSILNKKNLYSLKAHIDHKLLCPSEKLELVHQILLTCPNVRELDLKIEMGRYASFEQRKGSKDPIKDAVLAFDFSKHDGMLPPLEVLKIEGYRFDFAINSAHVDTEANTPLEMANFHAWLEHMDWSHLHSLHLSDPLTETLNLFADTLPSLRHFGIDGGDLGHIRAPLFAYLSKISSLESLSIGRSRIQKSRPSPRVPHCRREPRNQNSRLAPRYHFLRTTPLFAT